MESTNLKTLFEYIVHVHEYVHVHVCVYVHVKSHDIKLPYFCAFNIGLFVSRALIMSYPQRAALPYIALNGSEDKHGAVVAHVVAAVLWDIAGVRRHWLFGGDVLQAAKHRHTFAVLLLLLLEGVLFLFQRCACAKYHQTSS